MPELAVPDPAFHASFLEALGDYLAAGDYPHGSGVTPDDLRKVRKLQQERGERLERLLLDLGFVSEDDLQPLLSSYLDVPMVTAREFPAEVVPLGKLSLKYLRRAKVLPLEQTDATLVVAMSDPADQYALQGLEIATGLRLGRR